MCGLLNKLFEDLIGVPYVLDGRDSKQGFDCYGLVREASRRMGYDTPDYYNPENDPSFLYAVGTKQEEYYISLTKPEPGCIVTFRVHHNYTTHIGIVLDDCDQFIHVMRNKNVCVERLHSIFWRDRITGFYKWTKSL